VSQNNKFIVVLGRSIKILSLRMLLKLVTFLSWGWGTRELRDTTDILMKQKLKK